MTHTMIRSTSHYGTMYDILSMYYTTYFDMVYSILCHKVHHIMTRCTTFYYMMYNIICYISWYKMHLNMPRISTSHNARHTMDVRHTMTWCNTCYNTMYVKLWHDVRHTMVRCTTYYDTIYDILWHDVRHTMTNTEPNND